MARLMARENHKLNLESLATMNEALLKAKIGKPAEALPLFQIALQIDAQLDDRHGEAIDWYNFGTFLRDHGYPKRLAYAALLKSESLLEHSSDTGQRATVAAELKPLEQELGGKGGIIRNHPGATIAEALTSK